jgi:phospholipase C
VTDRKHDVTETITDAKASVEPERGLTRRTFLKAAGMAGAASLGGPIIGKDWAFARYLGSARTPIEHIVIACQENRSFDHYFGYAPFAGSFGPPAGYSQPDGSGGAIQPYRFTALSTPDVGHSWDAVHSEIDGGAMDGFYIADGIWAMG